MSTPVVDDQFASVGPRQSARDPCELEEVAGGYCLGAQLKQLNSAFQKLAEHGLGGAVLGLLGIENGVKRR